MSLLRAGPGKLFNMMERKRILTRLEKAALIIIVILAIVIVGLILRDQIEEYLKIFMEWYTGENKGI
jgi:cell division protein FtsL